MVITISLCVFNSLFRYRQERIVISGPFKLKSVYANDFVVACILLYVLYELLKNVFVAAGFYYFPVNKPLSVSFL